MRVPLIPFPEVCKRLCGNRDSTTKVEGFRYFFLFIVSIVFFSVHFIFNEGNSCFCGDKATGNSDCQ